MMRLRTKFMLASLVMVTLPVVLLYFLIRTFYESSIEVGLNPRVEQALEAATAMSQSLFADYKADLIALSRELAALPEIKSAFHGVGRKAFELPSLPSRFTAFNVHVIDTAGNIRAQAIKSTVGQSPVIPQSEIDLALRDGARLLPPSTKPTFLSALAPVKDANAQHPGLILVTAPLDSSFTRQSAQVIEVNQMFKTIGVLGDALQRGFLLAFFIFYIPIAGLSLFLGYWFARRFTAPLDALVEATRRIATGDWQHRVQAGPGGELGQLVEAFNTMVSEVKSRQDQVLQLEKMAIWREMARVLAHEIKNPLTPIQLTVQQLKDKYPNTDPVYKKLLDECAQIIHDEIQTLQTLVREFSDFARLPQLQRTAGDLNALIEDVAALYSHLQVTLELSAELPELCLDFEKMRRVLINFFENSVHSIADKGQGEIAITTERKDEHVVLRFADTGNGIPPEMQDKIFEPYFSTKKSGMGLGLAIVKRIVEEHGGRICLESAVGQGTTFEIILPIQ